MNPPKNPHPWQWIPTLYFAEALPYVTVMSLSVIMYERLGLTNPQITFYTSLLYLPWVVKPLWSPLTDLIKTKRWWIITTQILITLSLYAAGWSVTAAAFLPLTLLSLTTMALSSATHDIAADGFYITALTTHQQTFYVGIRSTFYRIATITGSGLIIMLAGTIENKTTNIPLSWTIALCTLATFFVILTLWHTHTLPHPKTDHKTQPFSAKKFTKDFAQTFLSFLRKPRAATAILFMLLYRLPEALLVKISNLFMIKPIDQGGLGLTTSQIGFVQGTIGVLGLTLGGILGGIAAAHGGLKRWLWPMVVAITAPDILYVYLSYFQPQNFTLISTFVFVEQFGYGFGFTAYMLYLIYYSQGPRASSHYALCTAFMALSMMLPGLIAGKLQNTLGYTQYFLLVVACCLATVAVTACLKIDPLFGKKQNQTNP